jgi:hypothetical protein
VLLGYSIGDHIGALFYLHFLNAHKLLHIFLEHQTWNCPTKPQSGYLGYLYIFEFLDKVLRIIMKYGDVMDWQEYVDVMDWQPKKVQWYDYLSFVQENIREVYSSPVFLHSTQIIIFCMHIINSHHVYLKKYKVIVQYEGKVEVKHMMVKHNRAVYTKYFQSKKAYATNVNSWFLCWLINL